LQVPPSGLPFNDDSFDAAVLMDVIHHLETPAETLKEVVRVLKPGGLFIAFEPNNLNPMVTLVYTFDRNEWGIFRLGMPGRYRSLLFALVGHRRYPAQGHRHRSEIAPYSRHLRASESSPVVSSPRLAQSEDVHRRAKETLID
jgi:ubiquinone/menaquinone biosynthesis C-methylase UbiE